MKLKLSVGLAKPYWDRIDRPTGEKEDQCFKRIVHPPKITFVIILMFFCKTYLECLKKHQVVQIMYNVFNAAVRTDRSGCKKIWYTIL